MYTIILVVCSLLDFPILPVYVIIYRDCCKITKKVTLVVMSSAVPIGAGRYISEHEISRFRPLGYTRNDIKTNYATLS